MDGLTLFWIIAAVAFGILEAATVQLVSVWFCISSVVSAFAAYITHNTTVSVVVFVVVSAILVAATRPLVKSRIMVKPQPTNTDRIIGKKAVVTTAIDSRKNEGQVKVDGQVWSAKCDDVVSEGETVEIEKIEGVKVVVKK